MARSRRSLTRSTAAVLGLAALLTVALQGVVAPGSGRTRSQVAVVDVRTPEERVWNVLLVPARVQPPSVDVLAAEIQKLGNDAVAPAVAILLGEIEQPAVDYAVHARAIDARSRILTAALRRLSRPLVLAELDRRVASAQDVDQRLFLAQIESEIGGSESLDRVVSSIAALDPVQWQRPFVRVRIERALERFVTDDARLARPLAKHVTDLDPRLAPSVLRALVTAQSPVAVPAALHALGRDAELDLVALDALATVGEQGSLELDESDLARLRGMLDVPDARVRRGAATALARIGDDESAAPLVEMVASSDAVEAALARGCLKILSGGAACADAESWRAWLDAENAWAENDLPAALAAFTSGDPELVMASVTSLPQHPLYRQRIAAGLRPALASEQPGVQRAACSLYATLRLPAFAPWMIDLLGSEDESVRTAAHDALRSLTRRDLPAEPQAWHDALGW